MKTLFIHVGPHKTGSTYIQKNLFEQSDVLLQQGVMYPKSLIGPQWGHHKLVEKVKQRDVAAVSEFLRTDEETLLVSSENFEDLNEEDIHFLSTLTVDFNVEVIFFKRAYSKLLVSAWQESVKQGEMQTWSEFLLEHALKPFKSKILNSSSVLENWGMLANRTHVFDYDAMLSEGVDIAEALCNKVLNAKIPIQSAAINQSMNLADIEIIRMLNHRYVKRTGQHPRTLVRDQYIELKKQKNITVTRAFEMVNEELVEETLDECWTINFFENKFSFREDMYFSKKIESKKNYRLPSSNVALSESFISTLVAIEKMMTFDA